MEKITYCVLPKEKKKLQDIGNLLYFKRMITYYITKDF